MEAKKGKGCMSTASRILAIRGKRPLDSLRRKMRDLAKKKPLTDSLVSTAKANVASLQPSVKKARAFIEEACRRKDEGKLDEESLRSETLQAKTIISLYEVLEATLGKAVEARDNYAVMCVNIAAQVLSGRIESSSMLRKDAYPSGDMKEAFMEAKASTADEVHTVVMDALDGSHAKYEAGAPLSLVSQTH